MAAHFPLFSMKFLVSTILLLLALAATTVPSRAQAPATTTAVSVGPLVAVVYLLARSNNTYRTSYNVVFDINEQTIGGLGSAELSDKFRDKPAAPVLNFMEENGYRVVGFTATPAKDLNNSGGGLEGYAIFMERTR